MEITNVLIIIISVLIIEIIIVSIKAFKIRQLNHLPTFNYPLEEVYFEIISIESATYDVVAKYTAIICFFKKPNAKQFVYDQYCFYDKRNKYNVGDRLYLNKKQ